MRRAEGAQLFPWLVFWDSWELHCAASMFGLSSPRLRPAPPLAPPAGQFGTRLQGGKDAASPRYIFTRLAPLTRHLFNEHDDRLLTYLNEEGQSIEPEWCALQGRAGRGALCLACLPPPRLPQPPPAPPSARTYPPSRPALHAPRRYMPVVPTVLVNGADGIGTGWSTSIPNFNPADLVRAALRCDGLHCGAGLWHAARPGRGSMGSQEGVADQQRRERCAAATPSAHRLPTRAPGSPLQPCACTAGGQPAAHAGG